MSGHKKPGKNSSRRGGMKSIPKAISVDGASGSNAIPSPFLRAGFDIGVNLSAPVRQHSNEVTPSAGTGDATGQADITTTNTTTPPHTPTSSIPASTKKSSGAQAAKKGLVGLSKKQALAMKTLGMEEDDITDTPKKSKTTKTPKLPKIPKASKAQKTATVSTPKKPNKGKGKVVTPPKITPSKRTHDDSFAHASYWSGKPKDEEKVFDSESDKAAYKDNDRSDHLQHISEDEDDFLKREREFALYNEIDDDDEYLTHYHGEDTPIRKHRT
ncbi:hypothetical protein VMCG_09461 [Cytospora schulzeri]|uniref:Uncharacterized protein n=1 Tax=Cytospora schulzeri TaxID=448051 RepID=A0A423VKI4_9PEZI|nr:hypothetical protein VMCG_09461 [Valsa malicola]